MPALTYKDVAFVPPTKKCYPTSIFMAFQLLFIYLKEKKESKSMYKERETEGQREGRKPEDYIQREEMKEIF